MEGRQTARGPRRRRRRPDPAAHRGAPASHRRGGRPADRRARPHIGRRARRGRRREAFARGQAQRYQAWHRQIHDLAERGVADGEFASRDLDGFTVRFAALADGLALQRLRQAHPLSTEEARRHLNRLIERELVPRSSA
ncbi:TetR family transcriptional regulator C-terminal domain-containing protein [Streptomyces sp. NPDC048419]|uniref:TetR family transcriptional regulator C-terminal domain-containing protein n=1 Tax=Streptomyces sp. NPDC048419 TaxID=3365547 RepID=UPI00371FC713